MVPLVDVNPRTYNSSTNPEGFVLGQFLTTPDGRVWRFVRAANGAGDGVISQGQIAEWASATDYIVSSTTGGGSSLGRLPAGYREASVSLAKNNYGWLLVKGFESYGVSCGIANGSGAPGKLLTSGATAGRGVDVVNAYDASFGQGILVESGSGLLRAMINLKGGWTVPTSIGTVEPGSYNSSTNAEGFVPGEYYSYMGAVSPVGVYRFVQNANAAGDAAIRNGDVVEWASLTLFTVSSTRAAGSSLGRSPAGVGVGAISKNNFGFVLVAGRHTSIPSTTGTVTVPREQTTHTVTGEGTNVVNAYDVPWGAAHTAVSGGVYSAMVQI